MINVFNNINYENTVGNIVLENDRLIYSPDRNSANDNIDEVIIFYDDIDKDELLKTIRKPNLQIIEIATKKEKFHFEFNFTDDYDKFINKIQMLFCAKNN